MAAKKVTNAKKQFKNSKTVKPTMKKVVRAGIDNRPKSGAKEKTATFHRKYKKK